MNLSFLILVGTLQRVKVEALYNDTKTTDANRGCPGQTRHVGTLFKADVGLGDLPAGFSHLKFCYPRHCVLFCPAAQTRACLRSSETTLRPSLLWGPTAPPEDPLRYGHPPVGPLRLSGNMLTGLLVGRRRSLNTKDFLENFFLQSLPHIWPLNLRMVS